MHRTTLILEGPVESQLRELAAKEKRSFKDLVNDLLKKGLQVYKESKFVGASRWQWNTATASPKAMFDPSSRASYLDFISKKIS